MPGLLANACLEEPDALMALVRVCGGAPRATGGLYPENRLSCIRIMVAPKAFLDPDFDLDFDPDTLLPWFEPGRFHPYLVTHALRCGCSDEMHYLDHSVILKPQIWDMLEMSWVTCH